MSWQPPTKDGGSPLTGYVIEQRDTRRAQWVKAGDVDKDTTSFKVSKLLEDNEYVFKVIAENAEGQSAPLESQSAKPTKPKCKIYCTSFHFLFSHVQLVSINICLFVMWPFKSLYFHIFCKNAYTEIMKATIMKSKPDICKLLKSINTMSRKSK